MNIPEYIFDRYTQRYAVEVVEDSELSFYIKLKDRDRYIGQMLCNFLPGDVMILEDLFIRSDTNAPEKWTPGRKSGRMVPELPFLAVPDEQEPGRRRAGHAAMNYRNRGLGSALIIVLFELAASRQVKTVFGSLISEDVINNPHLPAWYIKRGFSVSGPFKGCIPDAETYLRFDLPALSPAECPPDH
jgi:hypothetical protein